MNQTISTEVCEWCGGSGSLAVFYETYSPDAEPGGRESEGERR